MTTDLVLRGATPVFLPEFTPISTFGRKETIQMTEVLPPEDIFVHLKYTNIMVFSISQSKNSF